jgi:hypothetical protein
MSMDDKRKDIPDGLDCEEYAMGRTLQGAHINTGVLELSATCVDNFIIATGTKSKVYSDENANDPISLLIFSQKVWRGTASSSPESSVKITYGRGRQPLRHRCPNFSRVDSASQGTLGKDEWMIVQAPGGLIEQTGFSSRDWRTGKYS